MSHKNKVSMVKQIENILTSKLAIGESKHIAKQNGEHTEHIYSYATLEAYMKCCNRFASYCKQEHHAKNIQSCRQYINEYLQTRIDAGYSSYTIKLEACSLGKLYGVSTSEFIKTPARLRSDIQRSRNKCVRDRHFSPERNKDLVSLSHCSGLRRHELQALKPEHLRQNAQGKWCLDVIRGKNGMSRTVELIGPREEISRVVQFIQSTTTEKVFPKGIHNGFDAHGGRAIFAQRCYDHYKRPLEQLDRKSKMWCRCDRAGECFDRKALHKTSEQLGHHRIHVVSSYYVRAT